MTKPETTPWWSEKAGFFGPAYLREYEEILPPERTVTEVNFLVRTLGLTNGQPREILDVPCGHGRHAIALSEHGHTVTGVELNQHFVATAKAAATTTGVSPHFLQGDMREIAFTSEFDIVLNLFTSLGYFDDEHDDERFFAGAFRALRPGGTFVVDFINHDWLTGHWKARDWRILPDGSRLLVQRSFDVPTGRSTDQRTTIAPDGTEHTVTLSHRVYTVTELIALAKRVGFQLAATYGDFRDEPLTLDSKRAVLFFQKPDSTD